MGTRFSEKRPNQICVVTSGVPETRNPELWDTRNPEPGTQNPELGTRNPEPGTKFLMRIF